MKKFLVIPLVLLAVLVNGQTTSQIPQASIPPAYFLDSVRVNALPVFDPNKIESIRVAKSLITDESFKTKGQVYINTKQPANFSFLTLEQVAVRFAKTKGPCLFMIDNEIIKDIQNVSIDSSYILKCEVTNTTLTV